MSFVTILLWVGMGLNVALGVYHFRLVIGALRYHTMAANLLAGAWQMRDWPTLYTIESRGGHACVSAMRRKPTGR